MREDVRQEEDARRSERVKSFLRAQIIYNNRLTRVECIVKNISPDGAKIAIAESASIPAEFDLYIPLKAQTYRAKMIWRDATSIGVDFIQQAAKPAAAPIEEMSEETMALRIRALEMQNIELKTRVRELSRRLEDLGQDPELTNSQSY